MDGESMKIEWERSSRLVEGVSNQVLYLITAVIASLIPCLYYIWLHRHRALQTIHPLNELLVVRVRALIGVVVGNREEHVQHHQGPAFNADRVCPICYAQARYAVQTNCGHIFCGPCIIGYWRHGNWLGMVQCAVCRSQVTLMLMSFVETDVDTDADALRVTDEINQYNRRFSGEPLSWLDYLRDLPVLLPHLLNRLFSLDGIMIVFRLRIILCFIALGAYILSPLDIIPEAVFGVFGYLDDVFIVFVFVLYITVLYRQQIVNIMPNLLQ